MASPPKMRVLSIFCRSVVTGMKMVPRARNGDRHRPCPARGCRRWRRRNALRPPAILRMALKAPRSLQLRTGVRSSREPDFGAIFRRKMVVLPAGRLKRSRSAIPA